MNNTYKYKGSGFISGVPARDLTEAEFKSLPEGMQKACLESGLYVAPAKTTTKEVKEATNG